MAVKNSCGLEIIFLLSVIHVVVGMITLSLLPLLEVEEALDTSSAAPGMAAVDDVGELPMD